MNSWEYIQLKQEYAVKREQFIKNQTLIKMAETHDVNLSDGNINLIFFLYQKNIPLYDIFNMIRLVKKYGINDRGVQLTIFSSFPEGDEIDRELYLETLCSICGDE